MAEQKNVLLEYLYHKPLIDTEELLNTLHEYRDMVAPYVCDVSLYLDKALKEGKTVLLEGQLGTLKDPDHGIYPMVTSSSTLAAYGAIGAGIPPYEIKQVVTVCKAYSSAVGAGAFVSEIFGDEADELRRRGGDGGEFEFVLLGEPLVQLLLGFSSQRARFLGREDGGEHDLWTEGGVPFGRKGRACGLEAFGHFGVVVGGERTVQLDQTVQRGGDKGVELAQEVFLDFGHVVASGHGLGLFHLPFALLGLVLLAFGGGVFVADLL